MDENGVNEITWTASDVCIEGKVIEGTQNLIRGGKAMIIQEEIILMEALLRDVRGNWSDKLYPVDRGNRIAKSHNFEAIEKKLVEF